MNNIKVLTIILFINSLVLNFNIEEDPKNFMKLKNSIGFLKNYEDLKKDFKLLIELKNSYNFKDNSSGFSNILKHLRIENSYRIITTESFFKTLSDIQTFQNFSEFDQFLESQVKKDKENEVDKEKDETKEFKLESTKKLLKIFRNIITLLDFIPQESHEKKELKTFFKSIEKIEILDEENKIEIKKYIAKFVKELIKLKNVFEKSKIGYSLKIQNLQKNIFKIKNYFISLAQYLKVVTQAEDPNGFDFSNFQRIKNEQDNLLLIYSYQNISKKKGIFKEVSFQYKRFFFVKKESILYKLNNLLNYNKEFTAPMLDLFKKTVLNLLSEENKIIIESFYNQKFDNGISYIDLVSINNLGDGNKDDLRKYNYTKNRIISNSSGLPYEMDFCFSYNDFSLSRDNIEFRQDDNNSIMQRLKINDLFEKGIVYYGQITSNLNEFSDGFKELTKNLLI